MTFLDYQRQAATFATYPAGSMYPFLGLAEEAGEVAGKVAKRLRKHGDDGVFQDPELKAAVSKELGDVLWMAAACAASFGLSLDDVARENIDKLMDRKARGVIIGEGDDR